MLEKQYTFALTDEKLIERILEDDHVGINHMVLPEGAALPEHYSNSHVYMLVIRGRVTLQLNEQAERHYPAGSIVNIPYKTKMNVMNKDREILELFVVKAPSPKHFKG
ncbi:MAG: cupin domain-containing protein [Limnochordia bacterium]|nr:cupin domain-containing protein [Limnochordia bacterium]MDD2629860.1 cupin domain-containing protein [Limnochordia bacterium]